MKSKRIFYFDNIKGILILFAILFHSISVGDNIYKFNDEFILPVLFFLIPGFIFITGYFCGKSKHSPLKGAVRLFIIYAICQIVVTFYYADVLHIIDSHWDLLRPRYTLWYLLTCSFCYLLSIPFKKIGFKWSISISLILALLVGFIGDIGEIMSISRTITMFPFFVLGMYVKDINFFDIVRKYKYVWLTLMVGIYAFFMIEPNMFPNGIVYGKYSYEMVFGNNLEGLIKRIFMYGIHIIFTCGVYSLAPKNKSIFSILGGATLAIYVAHGILLKTFATILPLPDSQVIGTLILLVLSGGLSIIIGLGIGKLIKYFKNKKNVV